MKNSKLASLAAWTLAWTLLVGLPAAAQNAKFDPEAAEAAHWRSRHHELQQRVDDARVRLEEAEALYSRGRHSRNLRGEERSDAVAEISAARDALAKAEREWAELPDEARRAGAKPGWLRD